MISGIVGVIAFYAGVFVGVTVCKWPSRDSGTQTRKANTTV